MKRPGTRHSFKARDPQAFADLRAGLTQQARLEGLNSAISRIENGKCVQKATADKIIEAFHRLGRNVTVNELFEPCSTKSRSGPFTWKQLEEGADLVADNVFKVFNPDMVLTFSGPSSLFAGLVMAGKRFSQDKLGKIPSYLGMMTVSEPSKEIPPGFTIRKGKGFSIFIPKALTEDDPKHERKIAIIDDQITTGAPYQELRLYFSELGYRRANIHVACCVWYEGNPVIRKRVAPDTIPDFFAFPAYTEHFGLPWGEPISYPPSESPSGVNTHSDH